jgi:hypothetical protein
MTQHMTRADAIARMRTAIARGYPRGLVLFVLVVSGGAAFLFSAGTLRLGLQHMGVRYLFATVVGYLTFLLLIRAWIAYRRRTDDHDLASDIADAASGVGDVPGGINVNLGQRPAIETFAGGRSGGGGGGNTWGASTAGESASSFDADELWPVILAVVCIVGALFALVYVVYAAPLLLAEVALDAALVAGVYRKLRRQDTKHWLQSAVQRTWLPALATSLLLMGVGFAAQWAVPTAQSIGDVVHEWSRG